MNKEDEQILISKVKTLRKVEEMLEKDRFNLTIRLRYAIGYMALRLYMENLEVDILLGKQIFNKDFLPQSQYIYITFQS